MQVARHLRRPRLELKDPPHPENLHALCRETKDPEVQEAPRQALQAPHPRDGLWTIRNAAEWLSEKLG